VAASRGRSRRVSLPGVAELPRPATPGPDVAVDRPASGREQHTCKITVYLSADELFDLEHARLTLRRYGITADRGRIVREAIAVVLADLDARGGTSMLARRIADPPHIADSSHADGAGSAPGPRTGHIPAPRGGFGGGDGGGGGGHDG
jgi:hypothetical protein